MASEVQICNMALTRLGAASIVSLTDGTTSANLCNTLIDNLSYRVMIQGSWTTTIFRAELAQSAFPPEYDYAYAYQLPTSPKCLKVLDVAGDPFIEYKVEGDKLLTDESEIFLRYIGVPASTEDYGPLLTEAIEVLLASYLAYPLTANKELAMGLKKEYEELLLNSLTIDGQQGSKEEVVISDLTSVRYSGTSGFYYWP
jgi:hypothetical protein